MTHNRLYELVILHELAMAIGSSLDQQEMLNACLPLMLRRLGGRAITLFEQRDSGNRLTLEPVFHMPRHTQADDQLKTARKLEERDHSPWLVYRTQSYWGHAWPVPGFGILVLLRGKRLDESMCNEIGQISEKLGMALMGCRQYAQLQAMRTRLAEEADLHRETLLAIGDAIITTDIEGKIQETNPAAEQLLGYPRKHLVGHPLNQILHLYSAHIKTGSLCSPEPVDLAKTHDGIARLQRPEQSAVTVQFNIRRITHANGNAIGWVMAIRDISNIQALEEEIAWRATHDILTGLPNRAALREHLEHLLTQADQHEKLLAVALIDLDEFKPVNDRFGHAAGDKLLCAAAQRMKGILRASDTLARLGGDEFVIILDDLENIAHAEKIFERIIEQLSRPFEIEDQRVRISASLGYTLYPMLDETDADTLLRHADKAMYQAKLAGRNCYRLFDIREQRRQQTLQQQAQVITQALFNQEFRLYYQPKVDMRADRILGFEALARWQHPDRGMVEPTHFLPWMQNSDLAGQLGRFVIDEASRQLTAWHQAGHDWSLSINIAPAHLLSADFLDQLDTILARHPELPIDHLELEILESAAISDIDLAIRIIDACHERGLSVALDDFGTGYASLAYLKALPVDRLKIDQSFVRNMLADPGDRILIDSMIKLTHLFGQTPIAEGVETEEQGVLLMHLDCDQAQGFGISPPLLADEVENWAAQWQTPELWRLWRDTPWQLDDLPLLAARHDHLRRIEQVLQIVETGQSDMTLEEIGDHHCCRLGRWYDTYGSQRYGHLTAFKKLHPAHVAVHETCREIVQLTENGQMEQAKHLCARLLRLKDQVLHYLAELERQVARQLSADNNLPDSLSPSKSKAS